MQLPVGVHPPRSGRAARRRRLPAVVDVGVGDDDQLDVADAVARAVERLLEVGHRAAVVHARVDEHDAVAGLSGPRRSHGGRREGRGGAAAATRRAARARPGPPHAVGSACARSRRYRRGDGEEGTPQGAGVLLQRRRRQDARPARLDDAVDPAAVRRGRGRQHPLPRGRLASLRRVPLRAARRAGKSRARRRSASRKSCSRASASPLQEERVWIRGVLREHLAEHFPEMQAP